MCVTVSVSGHYYVIFLPLETVEYDTKIKPGLLPMAASASGKYSRKLLQSPEVLYSSFLLFIVGITDIANILIRIQCVSILSSLPTA